MNSNTIDRCPKLSIVVIAYDMARQLENTLYSLSAEYQQGVLASEYYFIVVENRSAGTLSADKVDSLPENFHYFLRDEPSKSPAAAINFGIQKASASFIGLMIDGAHMLTPQVLHYALMAANMADQAFVTVPVYHLGLAEQFLSVQSGYNEDEQETMLAESQWKTDGYRLFTVSCWCEANPNGYFTPIMESNCYFSSKHNFEIIGGADENFQQDGGGALNLDIMRKLGTLPDSIYFCLAGEGSFHQYHGGVTTSPNKEKVVRSFSQFLDQSWQNRFQFLERNPIILGKFSEHAFDNLLYSAQKMKRRFDVCRKQEWTVWSDDPA